MSKAERARDEVTFCTVLYFHHEQISLNRRYFDVFNPDGHQHKWLVTDNTPLEESPALDLPNVEVFPPVEGDHVPNWQHTMGLNRCVERAQTRFVIVLDPDFYVVAPNWLPRLLEHMQENELSFWGVPWHPQYFNKYRHFPCVHFMAIDTSRVPPEQLDFRPAMRRRLSPAWVRLMGLEARYQLPLDTGSELYLNFSNNPAYRSEIATPVWRYDPAQRPAKARLLDMLLPDRLAYLPKKRDYFTHRGFAEAGMPIDLDPRWEEFMWQGKPFGFHMRMNIQRSERGNEDELAHLRRSLELASAAALS